MESEQRQPRHRGEQNESESQMRAFEAGKGGQRPRRHCHDGIRHAERHPEVRAVFGEPRRMRNDMRPSFEARQARTSG